MRATSKVTALAGMALLAAVLMLAGTPTSYALGPQFGPDRGARHDRGGAERAAPDRGRFQGRGRFERPPARIGREHFDARFGHDRYYPRRGDFVRELPYGYRPFRFHDRPFYFYGGTWYAPGAAGFMVVQPPVGLFVSILPPFYSTVWFGGVPYYYADNVYYRWDPAANGYIVTDPPAASPQPAPPPAAPATSANLYIYPKNGQSASQQQADRFDCYLWARKQTGFDPTEPNGGVSPDQTAPRGRQYRRAMTACLTARGYSVR